MSTKTGIFVVAVVLSLFFVSCTSSVSIEEFETYKRTSTQEISQLQTAISQLAEKQHMEEVQARVVVLQEKTATLENQVKTLATKGEVSILSQELIALAQDFSALHKVLDDFVKYAGYEDPEDLLRLGSDIINVNRSIAELHQRLDKLRDAMALFVE